jgi:tetratricopeptide (TPR) repeat protein
MHRVSGQVTVTATFKVTDVTTGALITAKTLEERRDDSNTAVDEQPRPIDRDGLAKSARKAVLKKFLSTIVPHKEYLDAAFFTEGDLPQLETGVGYARRGDWKKAQETFNGAITDAERNPNIKTKVLGKAYWDLALAYEYNGDYDKALTTVDKAYQLTQDQDMLAEQDNIKRLQAEAKKLAEQGGSNIKPAEGGSDTN